MHREDYAIALANGPDSHGRGGIPVLDSVTQQIGHQLIQSALIPYALEVTFDVQLNVSIWMQDFEFLDDRTANGTRIHQLRLQRQSPAEAGARHVQQRAHHTVDV